MSNSNHNHNQIDVGTKPGQKWYQSHGLSSWETPTKPQNQGGFYSGRYLLRETPTRLNKWNSKRKSLSPEAKAMLARKVRENEAYNGSRVHERMVKLKEARKENMKLKKERNAKCYICKEKGHMYWACEQRKKIAMAESRREQEIEKQIREEEVKFPGVVHVVGDFILEGTQYTNWDNIWYTSNHYKHHFCPTRNLFNTIHYSFKMIEKEEKEKMFIFSYGIGDVTVEHGGKEITIRNVQYTPEVSLNILSVDLLEKQGYKVKKDGNTCCLEYMYEEPRIAKGKMKYTENMDHDLEQGKVITQHNKYLENYYESLNPKGEEHLIKGLEDLSIDKKEVQDYVDDDYFSYKGTLYAMKVNSFPRFLSFMNLIRNDSIVYLNWDVFSKKFMDMLKWFYLVYLNYEYLDELPPTVGGFKIDLLGLYKMVEALDGYVAVSLGGKWCTIARTLGLTSEEEGIIKACYQKFVDMAVVYYETAQVKWTYDNSSYEEGSVSWTAQESPGLWDNHAQPTANYSGVKMDGIKEEATSSEDDLNVIV